MDTFWWGLLALINIVIVALFLFKIDRPKGQIPDDHSVKNKPPE